MEDGVKNLNRAIAYIEKQEGGTSPEFMCIICGTAEYAKKRDDGIYVIPITSLRN